MKITKSSFVSLVSLLIGGFLGASALVTLAQTNVSGWSAPSSAPPYGNTPAPINVGTLAQQKDGWLGVTKLITANLQVLNGLSTVEGTVLVNDGNGNAIWKQVIGSGGTYIVQPYWKTSIPCSNNSTFALYGRDGHDANTRLVYKCVSNVLTGLAELDQYQAGLSLNSVVGSPKCISPIYSFKVLYGGQNNPNLFVTCDPSTNYITTICTDDTGQYNLDKCSNSSSPFTPGQGVYCNWDGQKYIGGPYREFNATLDCEGNHVQGIWQDWTSKGLPPVPQGGPISYVQLYKLVTQ